ncbi:MAG TPA: hypothetical protein VI122_03765, partial [Thermoleophilaceae bacterium]
MARASSAPGGPKQRPLGRTLDRTQSPAQLVGLDELDPVAEALRQPASPPRGEGFAPEQARSVSVSVPAPSATGQYQIGHGLHGIGGYHDRVGNGLRILEVAVIDDRGHR